MQSSGVVGVPKPQFLYVPEYPPGLNTPSTQYSLAVFGGGDGGLLNDLKNFLDESAIHGSAAGNWMR